MQPVAGTFQRRAVVRRAQKHQLVQFLRPLLAGFGGLGQRAAGDQTAHAVAQHDDFVQRTRPVGHHLLQRVGQRAAVVRDVAAAVVVGVDRRQSQFAAQLLAVVVAVALPADIAHAQAVHQQQHATWHAFFCKAGAQRRQVQRLAVLAQLHGDGQRVAAAQQVVAQHTVERGHQRIAAR